MREQSFFTQVPADSTQPENMRIKNNNTRDKTTRVVIGHNIHIIILVGTVIGTRKLMSRVTRTPGKTFRAVSDCILKRYYATRIGTIDF